MVLAWRKRSLWRLPKCLTTKKIEKCHYNDVVDIVDMVNAAQFNCMNDPQLFGKLLEDVEKPLYPGCMKYTKLLALIKIYNLKACYGWSDKRFSDLLQLLEDILPLNNEMPLSMYEAKKTLNALGMACQKIHACSNDCILYRNQYKDAIACPTCGKSRWKIDNGREKIKNGVPIKVLWYFPPIPRFKRMLQSSQTAEHLVWHVKDKEYDGKLCHPSDSLAWKLVDHTWHDVSFESRNLRLALSMDGINPHKSMSSRHTC